MRRFVTLLAALPPALTLALALALTVVLASGCGGSEETPAARPPAPAATPREASPPRETQPAPAPSAQAKPVATAGASDGDATRGAPLYATYCASCHGAKGDGDGPVAASLVPKPAAHSDVAYMDGLSDEHLYLVISKGGLAVGKSPMMAGWAGTLNDAEIWDVISFVRTLSR